MANGRTHSREFKLALMHQWDRGERRPAQLCREHRISDSLLHRWRREYRERGDAAFSGQGLSEVEELQARVVALERTCGQLALENSILKKGVTLAGWRSDKR